ncbi:hypothetical protein PIB30_096984, partial [Stylosanthes scabra]|nr:hypothetical protein [Stylosanthes scabra]
VDSTDESEEVPEYISGEGQEENQNLGVEETEEEVPRVNHEMNPNQEPKEDPEEDQEEDPEMEEEIEDPTSYPYDSHYDWQPSEHVNLLTRPGLLTVHQ